MKRNGETVEYQVTLNIPHLRGKNQQNLRESPCFLREWRKNVRKNAFWLSLWESWRGAPERARTLTERNRHSDSIALPKSQLIAAWRLSGDGLALSVIACAMPPLPKGEAFASRKACPLCPRLSLWESWRGAPERARMLTEKSRRSDSIALPKRQLIAVRRGQGRRQRAFLRLFAQKTA